MAAELEFRCGMRWVDALVSGGTAGAEAGTLAIMAGGRAEDVERVRPILMNLGQRLTHMGDVGAGQVTKVCNQMIVACNALVIAEWWRWPSAPGRCQPAGAGTGGRFR